ncbi:MAG: DUF1822 family protein, partial [Saprospiraceae bacterium]|nr:DUF1822 family protein [Saprospiraceae bacterium]
MLGVSTALQHSYSWNAVARISTDIADLNLPEKGHLECRPMKSDNNTCYVPQDVWHNRIGYVVVQLDEDYKQGTLLGFVQEINSVTLDVKKLQSLDNLFEIIHSHKTVNQLSQWLENMIDKSWQNIQENIEKQAINPIFVFADIASQVANADKIEDVVTQLYATQKR